MKHPLLSNVLALTSNVCAPYENDAACPCLNRCVLILPQKQSEQFCQTSVRVWQPWFQWCFFFVGNFVACVAGGIVGARNNVLTAEPLKASGQAVRRMGRGNISRSFAAPPLKLNSARLQYRQLHRLGTLL